MNNKNTKKNIVITAGGTSERIDNVRKITNSSTGKLGLRILDEILKRENVDKIFYLVSKNALKPNVCELEKNKVQEIVIDDVKSLEVATKDVLTNNKIDYFIHSMAVSDYTLDYVTTSSMLACEIFKSNENNKEKIEEIIKMNKNVLSNENKISSSEDNLIIKLKPTPKIIKSIKEISPSTNLIGFKLLENVDEEELIDVAKKLMDKNKCSLVVANDLHNIRNGNHKAFIIGSDDKMTIANGKEEIAQKIVERMFEI